MELVLDLLLGLMLPSIVASVVVMLVASRFCQGRAQACGAPLSVAAGLIAGNALPLTLAENPERSPHVIPILHEYLTTTSPLPFLPDGFGWPALVAVLLGTLAITLVTPWISNTAARWSLLLVGTAALTACLLPSNLQTPLWFAGLTALTLFNTVVLDRTLQRETGWILPVAWAVVICGGAAALVLVAHSALFVHVAVLLATSLVGAGLFTGKLPQARRLVAPFMAVSMSGLMVAGYDSTFSDVPWFSFALVALAPLSLAALLAPQADRWPRWAQLTMPWLLMLVPVAAALASAIAAEGLGSDY